MNFDRLIYHLKFCIYFIVSSIALWTSVITAILTCRLKDSRNALFGAHLLVGFGKLLGVTAKVQGYSAFNENESFIFIMNHQSCLDLIILFCMMKKFGNLAPVAKKSLMYLPPFGLAVYVSDGFLVDKSKRYSTQKAMDEKVNDLKIRKRNLIMFPEGTRSDVSELLPFKKGAFHMSIQADIRILPVVVQKYPFLDHRKRKFSHGRVAVKILDPIEKLEGESVDDFTKRAYRVMNESFQSLNKI